MAHFCRLLSRLWEAWKLDNWWKNVRFEATGLARCLLCLGPVKGRRLCSGCERDLPWRGLQIRLSGRHQTQRFASFSYTFPIRQLIAQAKFSDRVGIATLLGGLMGEHPPQVDLTGFVVCAVPIAYVRHLTRGYNQAFLLAQPLARQLGLALLPTASLRRVHTKPQRQLGRRARYRNLRGAFYASAAVAGQKILLIDDVLTTGATFYCASRALFSAGALEVVAWACASVD